MAPGPKSRFRIPGGFKHGRGRNRFGSVPRFGPGRSGGISHFFLAFRAISNPERQNETKSRFSSCRCAAACGSQEQRLGRHEGASAGSRGHVTSRCRCPCGSGCRDRLVAPTELRGDHEPREVRQVISPIETPLFAAHFVHADRPYHALEAKFRLRQAAGLFRSPLLFLAQGAPKQSPRTNQRR